MHYFIYPSTSKIAEGEAVLLEITSKERDVQLFAEFDCEDILDVVLTWQAALFSAGFDTPCTVLTLVD
ncbi:hypothetical protein [Klebsiella pneumoniae]|uniref:hypothetical protein n=1 Tax=Klebsiella TaxID=570 RepID=UPI0011BDB8FD|nr:hypothetical protein [Klebsiella pneumoniae]MBL1250267.1 hypothetical protein [Klebsiella pneumoniae]MBN7939484.1 hypothetical protein [Klebsiella pneumoniae]MCF2819000.1 hypothetical protein [Klebsiella pneumoniae]MCJ4726888.1 hypothetical protein [Klebsiella pneumoniae]MCJ4771125.1 hypothetical protein [Klebsiella pneumoniae]